MADIKDIDSITVRKVNTGVYKCTSVYKGKFRQHYYIGCTKKKATEKFKDAILKGEI